MKDHKPDFLNNPTCRLINPSKSEIGIISKQILDNINKKVIHATQVNQWKSTSNVIQWFKALPEKTKHAFITFDVCDLYPTISEQLLMKALDYASQFTAITQQDRHIITHAKKSNNQCNCQCTKDKCPLEGKCLETNVVYQAIITTDTTTESYVGLATNFKERYRNHKTSFRHVNKRNNTELSKHEWKLKDAKIPFSIKWKVIRKCNPYNNITKKCNL